MKLKRGDLLIGLDKLRDDIKTLADDCNESGFLNEYDKLFDAWRVVNNIRQAVMEDNSITSSTVYSDSFDEMVQKDFTYKGDEYTWNDSDCVYYNDNGDEDDFFMEIPEGAITSAKKPIKSGISCISFEKNLNDYSNDLTVTVTYDYDDGRESDFYQKSIHECIKDANSFISRGYKCSIDGTNVENADTFDSEDSFSMVIKSSKKPIKSGINDRIIYKSDDDKYSIYLSDCRDSNHGKDPHLEYGLAIDGEIQRYVRDDDSNYKAIVEKWKDWYNLKPVQSSHKPIKSSHDMETLKKVIRAYLDKMGYKDVEGGVDAAADYILQNEEHYPDYDFHSKVKQWFKETKENYPETLIKASKTIKSGYHDTTEHPEGGGTCDNCHGEVMPGDGYESDFESAREIAQEALVDAFKLGNVNLYSYEEKQRFIDFLDMEDEDEFDSAISKICNMAFDGKSYQCPDCAKENIYRAAKEWVEDNYDTDDEIESSVIKSVKSEFGYDAHETMTFDEFKNFVKSVVEPVEMFEYKTAYFVILNSEEDCKKLQQKLDGTYGVGCTYYSLQDPNNEHHGKWQLMA